MPDIELSGGFTWGSIRTGMEEMRTFVSQTTNSVSKDIAGMFSPTGVAGALSVTFIEQGISKIVEYGARVFDLGKRFAVSTTAIQQFGNVATRNGASLDSVAMGFNRLDIATSKALGGNKGIIQSFANLGVSVEDLQNLSPEQIMLKIGSSSMNAADMVKILGRNGTELRQMLRALADGSETLGNALDAKMVAALKAADDSWKLLSQNLTVASASVLRPLIDLVNSVTAALVKFNLETAKAAAIDIGKTMLRIAMPGVIQSPLPSTEKDAAAVPKGVAAGSAITNADDAATAGGGGAAASKAESMQERINKLEDAHAAKARTDQEQLGALMQKQIDLKLDMVAADGDDEEQQKTKLTFLENQADIDKLSGQMAQDDLETQSKITAEREKEGAAADQALAKSKESTVELQLQLAGRDDLAAQAKIAFEYDQKIAGAQDAVTLAQKNGFTEVAKTNQALVQRLQLEKQNALAADTKARAEEAAAKAAALHAQDVRQAAAVAGNVGTAQDDLDALKEQRAEQDLLNQGLDKEAQQKHDNYEWQTKINAATDAANDAWSQMDQAYSDGKNLLGDQYAELAKINEATATELQLQEQISEQQKEQADNQRAWAQGMQNFANNAGSYAPGQLTAGIYGGIVSDPGVQALGAHGVPLSQWAVNMATDPNTGKIDMSQLYHYMIQYEQLTRNGRNLPPQLQAMGDARAQELARIQTQKGIAATAAGLAAAQHDTEAFETMFSRGNVDLTPYMPAPPASSSSLSPAAVQAQITLLQQQLSQLQTIAGNTKIPTGVTNG